MRERLAVYRRQTAPLVDFYRDLAGSSPLEYRTVDGMGGVARVRDDILAALAG